MGAVRVVGEGVLLLKVRVNGTNEFYFQWFVAGKKKQRKLGVWPTMSLTVARDKCKGVSPQSEAEGTLQNLIDMYVAKLKAEGAASRNATRGTTSNRRCGSG